MDIPTHAPGVKDPNHTAWDVVDNTPYEPGNQGGKTKIVHTDLSGPSGMDRYNGGPIVNNTSKNTGTTLPVAKPIAVMTSGDPNNSSATMGEVK